MKKIFMLFLCAFLAACENPVSSGTLYCTAGKNHIVDFIAYNDKAVLNVNGNEINLNKVKEVKETPTQVMRMYVGNDDENEEIALWVIFDIDTRMVIYYGMGDSSHSMKCDMVGRFESDYDKPTDVEKCIYELSKSTTAITDENGNFKNIAINVIKSYTFTPSADGGYETNEGKMKVEFVNIPTEDAIAITENWNPEAPNLYDWTDGISEYEMDACEALNRLKQYKESHKIGLDIPESIYVD